MIIRLVKNTQELKTRIPELQLDLLASLVRWWHTRQTFLVTMQPIDYFFSKLDFFRFSSIPTLNYSSHFHQTSSDRTKVQNWSSTQSKKTRSWTSSRMHSNKHKLLQYLQSRLSRCCTSTHRNISKCNASKTDENMIKPFSLWTPWRLYSHSQETPHS